MGSPSTPYFLYFHYFGHVVAHSCFSTSYTVHGLLFLSFQAPLSPFTSLRPICLSHGPVIHYSYRLGLMGFLFICQTLFCPCCWASSSHLGFQNGPQHSQIQNQRFTNTKYLMRIAHKPKRESQAIPKVATYQERANHQTTEPSNNKPLSLFQIATHKYQITKPRESLFSSTHTLYFFHSFLSNCRNTYVLFIHKASRLEVIALHQNCYES